MPKPTMEKFKEGLEKVKFEKNQLRILLYHYCAPRQTRTATQIAEWVEYDGWRGVNPNYYNFCLNLAKAMDLNDPEKEADNFKLILESALPGPVDGLLKLVMCRELVGALDKLGWRMGRE
jgi:hypothetical protein